MGGKLGPLSPFAVSRTTVDGCLVSTADAMRQLLTDFGLRPYRVFLVWVGWTPDVDEDGMVQEEELELDAGVEGTGRAVLLKEVELLPTPLIESMAGVAGNLDATGLTERGNVNVSQISMGYTEDQLLGLLPEFRHPSFPDTLKPGVSFFWEIQENRNAGHRIPGTAAFSQFPPADLRSPRRRFHVGSVPSRKPEAFEWTVSLKRADGERGRNGEVRSVEGTDGG
jgi:hypothetical protein